MDLTKIDSQIRDLQRRRVAVLKDERREVQSRLVLLDKEIASVEGTREAKAKRKSGGRKYGALAGVIEGALNGAEPMTMEQIVEKVKLNGKFQDIEIQDIRPTLYTNKRFERTGKGIFRLATNETATAVA